VRGSATRAVPSSTHADRRVAAHAWVAARRVALAIAATWNYVVTSTNGGCTC
jgi:hypothetical protein